MKSTIPLAHVLALLSALGTPGRAAAQTTIRPSPHATNQRTAPNSRIGGGLQLLYRHWAGSKNQSEATLTALRAAFPELLLNPEGDSGAVLLPMHAGHPN